VPSRASSRFRPCRSIWFCSAQCPRRSRATTSAHAGPAEAQAVVGEQQGFGVDLVGQDSRRRRLLVELALAGQGRRAGPVEIGQAAGRAAGAPGRRRANRPCAHAAPLLLAQALGFAGSPPGPASLPRALQRLSRSAPASARLRTALHSSPRSANDTTWPLAHDEVVQHAHVHQLARADFRSGSGIRRRARARPGPLGWLCARITAPALSARARLHHLARVDAGLCQRAAEQLLHGDQPVLASRNSTANTSCGARPRCSAR
jgi:hypothetical protein